MEARDLVGRVVDFLGQRENAFPGLGEVVGIATGLLHQVGVEVDDRRREREAHAVLLALDLTEGQQRAVVACLAPILLGGDQPVERLGDVAVGQDALTVEALEGDVGQLAGDGVAQHLLGGVLVLLGRLGELHLDVRIGRHELLGDLLVHILEDVGDRVLHDDFGLCRRGTHHRTRDDRGGKCRHS